jgi:predicted nucleic acid-binding protein
VPAVYADASALTKLIVEEPESDCFEAYVAGAQLLSSELSRAEIARALRRISSEDPSLALEELLSRTEKLLDEVTMAPIEGFLLEAAGELPEPTLGTLDALHVVTALYLEPIDVFATYDLRQGASARREGLRTVAPGT